MALAKDNYIDPNSKARWGFGVSNGEVTVGPQTVGETGGVDHARTVPDDSGAHNNGGGESGTGHVVGQTDEGGQADELDSLTAAQIKEQLDAKGIEYKASASKAELLDALKAAQ